MRRKILNLIVPIMILVLTLPFVAVLPVTSQDKEEIKSKLEELRKAVENEHPALENKVKAVLHQVEAGAYNGALNKLQNDVKKSISAWVQDPDKRDYLLGLVELIIDLIEGEIPPKPPVPYFEITADPDELEIEQGSFSTSIINVTSGNGFNKQVNLTLELKPLTDRIAMVLVPWNVTPPVNGSATSTLNITVTCNAEARKYKITVTGTSGSLKDSVDISLTVVAAPPKPDFTLEASPTALTIPQGGSNISVITIASVGGFSQRIDLAVTSTHINGVSTTLNPKRVVPQPDKTAISILTINVAPDAVPNNYTITVTGESNSLTHSADISLEVTEGPPLPPVQDFSIVAFPDSLVIEQDAFATSTIIVISHKGFNQIVNLTVTSEPIEEVTLTINPSNVTPPPNGFITSTLRVEVSRDAQPDGYEIIVTGTSGSLEPHSVKILLKVVTPPPPPPIPNFSIAASPNTLTIQKGKSDTSVITIGSIAGFSQTVDLAVTSAQITGVNTSFSPSKVTPSADSFAISILSVNVTIGAFAGSYNINVTGTSGSLTHTANITLEVTTPPSPPTPDFSLIASPSSLTIEQGDSATITIIVVSRYGFTNIVDLAVTSEPIAGVSINLDPAQVNLPPDGFATSTLRISVEKTATPNHYGVTITGTSCAPTRSINIPLKIIAEKKPPRIVSVMRLPEKPSYNDSVTVLASVVDEASGVKDVILGYSDGSAWRNVTANLKEGLYRASIPIFRFNSTIDYIIYASDNAGNWATSSDYSYVVVDPHPPMIGVPNWNPLNPAAHEKITINVTVSEPPNASGVERVTLWYGNETLDVWESIPMTLENESWTVVLTGQSGTTVEFVVEALDKAGNSAEFEDEFSVAAPPGFPLIWILIAIALILAAGAGTVYYMRRKRKEGGITSSVPAVPTVEPAQPSPPPPTPTPQPTPKRKPTSRRARSKGSAGSARSAKLR